MKKYKKPLKHCHEQGNCKRLCFIIDKEENKTFYCSVHGDYFVSKCVKKVIRR